MNTATIEREAMHLPPEDRAQLAQKLIMSLENLSESELEKLWLDEAERRAQEIDGGKVQLASSEEVSQKARALLR
jgi:putative addiction module component (TIGR02574 family)